MVDTTVTAACPEAEPAVVIVVAVEFSVVVPALTVKEERLGAAVVSILPLAVPEELRK